jgi:signal transduction histidine kinase
MAGTGGFALLTIWLGFALSGLLVRQVTGLAQQVRALRAGSADAINPGRYDEREVVELADTVNDYHRRMADMVERERAFTGNVSHELRTPLTAIRTSCELLEQDPGLSTRSRARLGQIERAAVDMQAMAESLLALARAQPAGAAQPVALAGAIRAALERCATRPGVDALAVTVDVPDGLRARAHGHSLAIVLSNLIENAARHAGARTLRFAIEDGCLTIADDGAGIAADALAHVFQRFYQAPGSGAPGHGIGLAMVGAICAHYGWTVGIDSAPGAGTRVSLALPGIGGQAALHENFTNA